MKKASIEPVFKYIFVIIAGSIILFFFINLTANQIKIFKKIGSAELVKSLDDELNAFSISEDSDKTIDLGANTVLDIGYQDNCNGFISIEGSMIKNNKIIFGHKRLSGNKIYAWTQSWKYPYKAVNFFYLSNPRTKYYLIGNNDLARELYGINQDGTCCENFEYIPKRFNIALVNSINEINQNELAKYDFVKFVYINQIPESYNNPKVKIISINTLDSFSRDTCLESYDDEDCHGTVSFEDSTNIIFIGKPMLYGAIFAYNSVNYNCAVENALDKLSKVTSVYINKANILADSTAGNCIDTSNGQNKYSNLVNNLRAFQDLEGQTLANIHDNMQSNMQRLRDYNNQILGGINCGFLF